MATFEFSETAVVPASPQITYSIIADYVNGHPRIVPEKVFSNMQVESGGYGAGTRIRFDMRVLGRTHTLRAAIIEPEPGRVLVETDLDTGTVTTFTVEPDSSGKAARVTIHTKMAVPGFAGWVQRWLVPRLLRPIYQEELRNLAALAKKLQAEKNIS
jgi:hypothetical protein